MPAYTTDRAELLQFQLDQLQGNYRGLRMALTLILTMSESKDMKQVARRALENNRA